MVINTSTSSPKVGFDPDFFAQLSELEARNFWFRSRNRLIVWAVDRYVHQKKGKRFLEIGCGTGFVLQAINQGFPEMEIFGSELFAEGLQFAAKRVPRASLIQLDAKEIPFEGSFDAVGVFDVLEHIDDDELVLRQIYKSLNSGGLLFITVPQHKWLWSPSDVLACHCRRYTANELLEKVDRAGFVPVLRSSFVTFLLPLMYLSRTVQKSKKDFTIQSELSVNPAVSWILEKVLAIELVLTKCGVRWPAGGSLLMIARKD